MRFAVPAFLSACLAVAASQSNGARAPRLQLSEDPKRGAGTPSSRSSTARLPARVAAAALPQVRLAPDHPAGVYAPGQPATWTITIVEDGMPANASVRYVVRKGGRAEIAAGNLTLENGRAKLSASRDDPGALLVHLHWRGATREWDAFGGAAFAPEKIAPSQPAPADFDAFWRDKLAALAAEPLNARVESRTEFTRGIDYFYVTLANVGGAKVRGQLAKPSGGRALPASLQLQWGGVYALKREWVIDRAKAGWLALNISAHDLPIDAGDAFYAEKAAGELKDYPGIGGMSRETTYFLRMILGACRAVDFLAQHPDWDRRTLVVHGASQGGFLALATAALHPRVTAVAANVPGGCDHTANAIGRAAGWPDWAYRARTPEESAAMLDAARTYDATNFAARIKVPALIGVALSDTMCPAEGIFAAANQLTGPREIVVMPEADHRGDHARYEEAFVAFLRRQQ